MLVLVVYPYEMMRPQRLVTTTWAGLPTVATAVAAVDLVAVILGAAAAIVATVVRPHTATATARMPAAFTHA